LNIASYEAVKATSDLIIMIAKRIKLVFF